MQSRGQGGRAFLLIGSIIAAAIPLSEASAASSSHRPQVSDLSSTHFFYRSAYNGEHGFIGGGGLVRHAFYSKRGGKGWRYAHAWGGMQCVPFARNASGIQLSGNAWTWWGQAAGIYERGTAPEPGSVLAFSSNGAMRLGHVAVVSRVVNDREIEIDHANWGGYGGAIARGMPVVDVSPNNDWSAVRVGMGDAGEFGSIYPTHGFIYGRPDRGTMVASNTAPAAPRPDLNPAPRDLRPFAEQAESGAYAYEEVAEAPAPRHHRHPWHRIQH